MRILTGIQPSGQLHIGNYFGAIKPAVELQTRGDCTRCHVTVHGSNLNEFFLQ